LSAGPYLQTFTNVTS